MSTRTSSSQASVQQSNHPNRPILFNEGWSKIYRGGIQKLINILQSLNQSNNQSNNRPITQFTNSEYMELYTLIYQMCLQKREHSYSAQLYEKFDQSINEYLTNQVLPMFSNQAINQPINNSPSQPINGAHSINQSLDGIQLIAQSVRAYENHKLLQKWMVAFFCYLDRFYVKRNEKKSLNEVAVMRFKQTVYQTINQNNPSSNQSVTQLRLTKALIEAIRMIRDGEQVDRQLVRDAIQLIVDMGYQASNQSINHSFHQATMRPPVNSATRPNNPSPPNSRSSSPAINLSTNSPAGAATSQSTTQSIAPPGLRVYVNDFEIPFLKATAEYYSNQSVNLSINQTFGEYLRSVEQRLNNERTNVFPLLNESSYQSINQVMYDTLLIQPQANLINQSNSGLRSMLEMISNNQSNSQSLNPSVAADLSRLFTLYNNVPSSLPPIASVVQSFINQSINQTISQSVAKGDDATGEQLIDQLIERHELYYELIKNQFQNHQLFQKSLRDAFESAINQPISQSSPTMSELLSTYMDSLLKKKFTDRSINQSIDQCLRLFTYLHDKDLFSEFYRAALATRLLLGKSSSMDAEKHVIGILKIRCGHSFTNKLEGMINDLTSSNNQSSTRSSNPSEFAQFLAQSNVELNMDFSVQTLSSGFWPTYPVDDMKLPPAMNSAIESYRVWYAAKTQHRKLRWVHDLGTVTLSAHYPKRKVDLIVSTAQAAILMCFNEELTSSNVGNMQLSIKQLQQLTGLDADGMKAQLKVLVNGKHRLLQKSPVERYTENDMISVNLPFSQPLRSIRIPNAARKSHKTEREATNKAVAEDRKHAMEANIVRVMKARKTCTHAELMSEVSKQLMSLFEVEPKQVKQRIEDLIQREFLERDKKLNNVYHYLA